MAIESPSLFQTLLWPSSTSMPATIPAALAKSFKSLSRLFLPSLRFQHRHQLHRLQAGPGDYLAVRLARMPWCCSILAREA